MNTYNIRVPYMILVITTVTVVYTQVNEEYIGRIVVPTPGRSEVVKLSIDHNQLKTLLQHMA